MKIANADIVWLDNGLPYSRQFDDVYFSRDDARGESRHVFIQASDLETRWQKLEHHAFTVGELGFGCGLNFLQTWQAWRQWRHRLGAGTQLPTLHYLAWEKYPLTWPDLQRTLQQWPDLAAYGDALLGQYPDHSAGCHRLLFADGVVLDLIYADALTALSAIPRHNRPGVDAWFADGFSPRVNPELWSTPLFAALAHCSRPGATLTTYSVAGQVRKDLQNAGFVPARKPGFGSKREMLVARLAQPAPEQPPPAADTTPWFTLPAAGDRPRQAVVIGAGLAGSSVALSLARRGVAVTVVEAGTVAAGASGQSQMALRCRLFAEANGAAAFYLHSFLFTRRLLAGLSTPDAPFWHPCGVAQFNDAINRRRPVPATRLAALYPAQVLVPADRKALSERAGVELTQAGIFLPLGGWVQPLQFCHACLAHPAITLRGDCQISTLRRLGDSWQLLDRQGHAVLRAATVILANGHNLSEFSQTRRLPVENVRGQNTLIRAGAQSRQLATVIGGERTVFPAHQQQQTLSASYGRHDSDLKPRSDEDRDTLARARGLFADPATLGADSAADICGSRVSIRANTPDRLPLVGPLPDLDAMQAAYGELARDASLGFDQPGRYWPGLYVSAAHGSNGLATAPFAGEILASLICAEAVPVSGNVLNALNPTRFLIRDLKKQKFAVTD